MRVPVVEVIDENGEIVLLELLDTIKYNSNSYVLMTPFLEESDIDVYVEMIIMREFKGGHGEPKLESVDDETLYEVNKLFFEKHDGEELPYSFCGCKTVKFEIRADADSTTIPYQYANELELSISTENLNLEECKNAVAELERLTLEHNGDFYIALAYAKGIEFLNRKLEETDEIFNNIKKVEILVSKYDGYTDFVNIYAWSILPLSLNDNDVNAQKVAVEMLKAILEQFKCNGYIAYIYAKSITNSLANQTLEERLDAIAILETLNMRYNSDNNNIVRGYLAGLGEFIRNQQGVSKSILDKLEVLMGKYKDDIDMVETYALSLFPLTWNHDYNYQMWAVNKLEDLVSRFKNNEYTARQYAMGICNLMSNQELSGLYDSIKKFEVLIKDNSKNISIMHSYALGLYHLSNKQEPDSRQKTLTTIATLIELYKNDKNFEKLKIMRYIEDFLLGLEYGYMLSDIDKSIFVGSANDFVDMVFYNINLKAYVLVGVGMSELKQEYAEQMKSYLRYYTGNVNSETDKLPVGIILCKTITETVAEYVLGNLSNQVFESNYAYYIPKAEHLTNYVKGLFEPNNLYSNASQNKHKGRTSNYAAPPQYLQLPINNKH